jgi:hypothetical protein
MDVIGSNNGGEVLMFDTNTMSVSNTVMIIEPRRAA